LGTRLLLAPPQVFAKGLGEPLFSGCTLSALTRRERRIFIHLSMLSEGHRCSRAALRVYQTAADGGRGPAHLANICVVVYLLSIPAGLGPDRALP
jgi:hypothetical protein